MKKVLSLILAFALAVSCITVGFAENTTAVTDSVDTANDVKLGLLKALSIIPETGVNVDKLSRADFAVYVARMIGVNDFAQNNTRYFYDVPMNHYALNSVNTLLERGVISLSGDRNFRPEEEITADEACKMVVSAIGYDDYAKMKGGFPSGYRNVATREGILSGIDMNNFDANAALDMIYNTLKTEVFDIVSVSTDDEVLRKTTGKTVLSLYHNIYFGKGAITAASGEKLYSDISTHHEEVIVDGIRCVHGGKDFTGLLGEYVEYFYKVINDKTNQLLYATPASDETIKMDIADFGGINGNVLNYYTGSKSKNVALASDRTIVYNGRPLVENVTATLNALNYGDVTVKKSTGQGEYDVVVINDYMDFYYTAGSETEERISDSKLSNRNFELRDYDIYKFVDKAGNVIGFSDLAVGNIISVRNSKDNKVFCGIVCTDMITNKYNSVKYDKKASYITLGDKEYTVLNSYFNTVKNGLSIGTDYTARMNFLGNVALIELPGAGNEMFGVLLGMGKDDNAFDSKFIVRIYGEDGKIVVLDCAEKLNIDGNICDTEGKICTAFGVSSIKDIVPQGIRFKVVNEKLRYIDTTNPGSEDPKYTLAEKVNNYPTVTSGGSETAYSYTYYLGNRFSPDIIANANTKHIACPNISTVGSAEAKKFAVSGLVQEKSYSGGKFYALGTDATYCAYVVTFSGVSYQFGQYICLVAESSEILDEEGDSARQLTILQNGQKLTYTVNRDAEILRVPSGSIGGRPTEPATDNNGRLLTINDIEKGDVIRIILSGNEIVVMEMIYDKSELYNPETGYGNPIWPRTALQEANTDKYPYIMYDASYFQANFQLSFSRANSIDGEVIKAGYRSAQQVNELIAGQTHYMVYDVEKDEAYLGTIADVRDYKTYGKFSTLILETYNFRFRSLVVFK